MAVGQVPLGRSHFGILQQHHRRAVLACDVDQLMSGTVEVMLGNPAGSTISRHDPPLRLFQGPYPLQVTNHSGQVPSLNPFPLQGTPVAVDHHYS